MAIYLPMPDEIDPRHLRRNRRSARFYVPVMVGRHDMRFARYRPGLRQTRNRLGIAEPRHTGRRLWLPRAMDLVIMPLLGFDSRCNRLGQGGGHYDRAFSFLAHRRLRHGGPRLVGLAFECQRVDALPHEPWDIPLDAVVTESSVYLR